jgi:hypothetical protein
MEGSILNFIEARFASWKAQTEPELQIAERWIESLADFEALKGDCAKRWVCSAPASCDENLESSGYRGYVEPIRVQIEGILRSCR